MKIILLGFGNIGQAIIPLLKTHFSAMDVWVIERNLDRGQERLIEDLGLHAIKESVTRENYRQILSPMLGAGDFLVNLATSISSRDLIQLAQANGSFYIDSCIDPWEYAHSQGGIETSNYLLREQILELRPSTAGKATAIVAHGANPGFVSILVKRALIDMATAHGVAYQGLKDRNDWARLARDLDVRVIQISERDTQFGTIDRSIGEFVNTWSVDGFVTECLQPAELGWGTHETELPQAGHEHAYGCQAAISINHPSVTLKVKSWSPNYLDFEGYLITHNEAISLADYLTYRENGRIIYRPTSYYAYHPCDEAVESLSLLRGLNPARITSSRILKDEIRSGIDELGVFLISGKYSAYWLGSNLSIGKARKMARHNNATSLQVVSSLVAGMAWALENPRRGVLESEDLDHEFIYAFTEPYWSPMVAQSLNWLPRAGARELLFADFLVQSDV
jgi:homospermidine synthase